MCPLEVQVVWTPEAFELILDSDYLNPETAAGLNPFRIGPNDWNPGCDYLNPDFDDWNPGSDDLEYEYLNPDVLLKTFSVQNCPFCSHCFCHFHL